MITLEDSLTELTLRLGTTEQKAKRLMSPDAAHPDNADWPKRTRDFWLGVSDLEDLAERMGRVCRTGADLEHLMGLPGIRLATDIVEFRKAAEILRIRRGW